MLASSSEGGVFFPSVFSTSSAYLRGTKTPAEIETVWSATGSNVARAYIRFRSREGKKLFPQSRRSVLLKLEFVSVGFSPLEVQLKNC